MADQIITLKIPSAKVAKAMEGYLSIYPNIELVDQNDRASGKKYTDKQWIVEMFKRILIRDIKRGLQKEANIAARVAEDNSLVEVV